MAETPIIDAAQIAIMECDEDSAWDSIAAADCRNAAIAALRAALPFSSSDCFKLSHYNRLMRELYKDKFR